MSTLTFDMASCVRASAKDSQCTKCLDICPVQTITFKDNIPTFTPSACVDCAGCVGICPTSAFATEFNTTSFMFDFLESDETLISCKKNVPCISALPPESLLSLAMLSQKPLTLDMGHCANCDIKTPLLSQIDANVKEVNYILQTMHLTDKALVQEEVAYQKEEENTPEPSRRALFGKLNLKGAAQAQAEFDKAVEDQEEKIFTVDSQTAAKIKEKKLTDKRKFLFLAARKVEKPTKMATLDETKLSFVSQKIIDNSCTNCQICYRICPTGALSSNARQSFINFEASLCVKCALCHDVCQSDSITLAPTFNPTEFFSPSVEKLAEFSVIRCDECSTYFTSLKGERFCMRCQVEEDEARSLHGEF